MVAEEGGRWWREERKELVVVGGREEGRCRGRDRRAGQQRARICLRITQGASGPAGHAEVREARCGGKKKEGEGEGENGKGKGELQGKGTRERVKRMEGEEKKVKYR